LWQTFWLACWWGCYFCVLPVFMSITPFPGSSMCWAVLWISCSGKAVYHQPCHPFRMWLCPGSVNQRTPCVMTSLWKSSAGRF
jgi:hypothetical protein